MQAVTPKRNADALRQALVRKRAKELGKLRTLPKTTDDLVLQGIPALFTRTIDEEPFVRLVVLGIFSRYGTNISVDQEPVLLPYLIDLLVVPLITTKISLLSIELVTLSL